MKVKADEALKHFEARQGKIKGFEINFNQKYNKIHPKKIKFADFLINKGEPAFGKYGNVLRGILNLLK